MDSVRKTAVKFLYEAVNLRVRCFIFDDIGMSTRRSILDKNYAHVFFQREDAYHLYSKFTLYTEFSAKNCIKISLKSE